MTSKVTNLKNMSMAATIKDMFRSQTNKTLVDYQGGTNAIYIGLAEPGTRANQAKWQITKMAYDDNNNMFAVEFAGGSLGFVRKWSKRKSYIYS